MHIIKKWQEWRKSLFEKHLEKAKNENKCPECHGRGLFVNYFNDYSCLEYAIPLNCPSCNGTGKFPN